MRRAPAALLAPVLLWSCAPAEPVNMAADAAETRRPSGAPNRRQDTCDIYRSMFPASVIVQLDGYDGDARISTRTETGDATPSEVRAVRAAAIEATGGAESSWASVPEAVLNEAFQSWRAEPLPSCDWQAYAREVSAPARNGRIGQVLTSEESGSYTRLSRPFFVDRDTAIVLVREVLRDGVRVTRKLVYTYRDGGDWAMLPHTFEERSALPR